jgi:hypothetical protein
MCALVSPDKVRPVCLLPDAAQTLHCLVYAVVAGSVHVFRPRNTSVAAFVEGILIL